MSTSRAVTIWCDADDPDGPGGRCGAWTDHGDDSVRVTRAMAARHGWRHRVTSLHPGFPRQAVDLCPDHAKKETR